MCRVNSIEPTQDARRIQVILASTVRKSGRNASPRSVVWACLRLMQHLHRITRWLKPTGRVKLRKSCRRVAHVRNEHGFSKLHKRQVVRLTNLKRQRRKQIGFAATMNYRDEINPILTDSNRIFVAILSADRSCRPAWMDSFCLTRTQFACLPARDGK
jgi:hypothetical protein